MSPFKKILLTCTLLAITSIPKPILAGGGASKVQSLEATPSDDTDEVSTKNLCDLTKTDLQNGEQYLRQAVTNYKKAQGEICCFFKKRDYDGTPNPWHEESKEIKKRINALHAKGYPFIRFRGIPENAMREYLCRVYKLQRDERLLNQEKLEQEKLKVELLRLSTELKFLQKKKVREAILLKELAALDRRADELYRATMDGSAIEREAHRRAPGAAAFIRYATSRSADEDSIENE